MNWSALFMLWFAIGFVLASVVLQAILDEEERPCWHPPTIFVVWLIIGPPILAMGMLIAAFDAIDDLVDDGMRLLGLGSWRRHG